MSKPKKRTREQWLSLFTQFDRSGLTMVEFCRQHRLAAKYFSLKRRHLGLRPPGRTPTPFSRVQVERAANTEQGSVVIERGAVRLTVSAGVPVEYVVELLSALSA